MTDTTHGAHGDLTGDADRVVPDRSCAKLETLAHIARMLEQEAEELAWTRTDPVDLPGLRRAAQLVRMAASAHVESAHGPSAAASHTVATSPHPRSGGDPSGV